MAVPSRRSAETAPAAPAVAAMLEPLERRTLMSDGRGHTDGFWYVPPGETAPVEHEPRYVHTASKWGPGVPIGSPVALGYSYSNLLTAGLPGGLSAAQISAAIVEAMQVWSAVVPMQFTERVDPGTNLPTSSDGSYNASGYPELRFGRHAIDGASGSNVLAHAYFPGTGGLAGDTHFDSDNTWALVPGGSSIDLLETAVHEFGHAIGLNHEAVPPSGNEAIMNPVYAGRFSGPGSAFLLQDDINGIQARYGSGLGYVLDLGGTMYISGTDGDNAFSLNVGGGNITAMSAGFGSFTVPASGVSAIVINGRGGGDTFNVETNSIPVTVNGGGGNDALALTGGLPSVRFMGGIGDNVLTVNTGSYTFGADALLDTDNLTVNVNTDNTGSAGVTFSATQHLAALNLGTGATATMEASGNRYLHTKALNISTGGELVLSNNDLLLDYSGTSSSFYNAVKSYITTGRDTGTSGITSTTGAAPTDRVHAPVDNAIFGKTLWMGQSVDPSTVIVKYTYYGDSNLDGAVTGDDYLAIDSNLGILPGTRQWIHGDFNFDGAVTGDDYLAIDTNLGKGVPTPLASAAMMTYEVPGDTSPTESDEPAVIEPVVVGTSKASSKKLGRTFRG